MGLYPILPICKPMCADRLYNPPKKLPYNADLFGGYPHARRASLNLCGLPTASATLSE